MKLNPSHNGPLDQYPITNHSNNTLKFNSSFPKQISQSTHANEINQWCDKNHLNQDHGKTDQKDSAMMMAILDTAWQWRHNGCDGISNHQPHHCLLGRRSKKTSKLRVTGLCAWNSPVTGEFPTQMASNAGNVSIWWHHHGNENCASI